MSLSAFKIEACLSYLHKKALVSAVRLNQGLCVEESVTMAAARRRVWNTDGSLTVLHSRLRGKLGITTAVLSDRRFTVDDKQRAVRDASPKRCRKVHLYIRA